MAVQQPSVNAGLRPPPSAADGVDRGLPDSRWHLIDQWPGAASYGRQILCQIIGHRRIYADSRRHRQQFLQSAAAATLEVQRLQGTRQCIEPGREDYDVELVLLAPGANAVFGDFLDRPIAGRV